MHSLSITHKIINFKMCESMWSEHRGQGAVAVKTSLDFSGCSWQKTSSWFLDIPFISLTTHQLLWRNPLPCVCAYFTFHKSYIILLSIDCFSCVKYVSDVCSCWSNTKREVYVMCYSLWLSCSFFLAAKTPTVLQHLTCPSTLLGISKLARKHGWTRERTRMRQKSCAGSLTFILPSSCYSLTWCSYCGMWLVVLKISFLMWAKVFLFGCRRKGSMFLRLPTLLFTKL